MPFDPIEYHFSAESGRGRDDVPLPYVIADNFPKLGLLTALKFLDWVEQNPEGVISLPTGKTPEYFIKWTQYLLNNWQDRQVQAIREKYGYQGDSRPGFRALKFVQIDEFYPIHSSQHNSFFHYVQNYYIQGFNLDASNGLYINCDEIPLADGKVYEEIFPDLTVDISLRYRECKSEQEELQQRSIFMIDQWCGEYEAQIRDKGGIGFFLGGLGPDGHIAFNVRGSDFNSTTRLTHTNFETQAAAAGDLGGIEISRNRLVITIGLATITANPEVTAIIIAAGEAKARIVKNSLENSPNNIYPGTVLQSLPNSRFYLTSGAAAQLRESTNLYYTAGDWSVEKSQKAIIDLCKTSDTFGHRLNQEQLENDPFCRLIPDLGESQIEEVIKQIDAKLMKGVAELDNQVFLHTGPHHDDVMLGYLPHIMELITTPRNQHYFTILTSGFTSVSNRFLIQSLETAKYYINQGLIQMLQYPDFYKTGYRFKWDKDVYHTLMRVAGKNERGQRRGLSHRLIRSIVDIYKVKSDDELLEVMEEIISILSNSYDGEKNPSRIQRLKGMIREFEEELVWAHFGVQVKKVHHLRLGFYTGEIFTEQPTLERDVKPILSLLEEIQPTVLSLALDPEGSGPDTHYKVLQAIAEALRQWGIKRDISQLRIWGYRNVWFRFHPAEADIIVPVSLNGMAVLRESFMNCYLSQKEASFPSYELDGPFCDLSQKIWVQQLQDLQLLLGKDYFYQNPHPRLRSAHGLVYLKELSVTEFLQQARHLEESVEGSIL